MAEVFTVKLATLLEKRNHILIHISVPSTGEPCGAANTSMCPGEHSSYLWHYLYYLCHRPEELLGLLPKYLFAQKMRSCLQGVPKPFCAWVQECSQMAHGLLTSLVCM